jgi:hypothetical protein
MFPVGRSAIRGFLDGFVARLLRPNCKVRPSQIDRLREVLMVQFFIHYAY